MKISFFFFLFVSFFPDFECDGRQERHERGTEPAKLGRSDLWRRRLNGRLQAGKWATKKEGEGKRKQTEVVMGGAEPCSWRRMAGR